MISNYTEHKFIDGRATAWATVCSNLWCHMKYALILPLLMEVLGILFIQLCNDVVLTEHTSENNNDCHFIDSRTTAWATVCCYLYSDMIYT